MYSLYKPYSSEQNRLYGNGDLPSKLGTLSQLVKMSWNGVGMRMPDMSLNVAAVGQYGGSTDTSALKAGASVSSELLKLKIRHSSGVEPPPKSGWLSMPRNLAPARFGQLYSGQRQHRQLRYASARHPCSFELRAKDGFKNGIGTL